MCNRESLYCISGGKEPDVLFGNNLDNKEGPADHQSWQCSSSAGNVSSNLIKSASFRRKFYSMWLLYLCSRSIRGRDCTISIVGCVCNDSSGDQNNVLLFFSLPELKLLQGKDPSFVSVRSWSRLSSINYRTYSGRPISTSEDMNLA